MNKITMVFALVMAMISVNAQAEESYSVMNEHGNIILSGSNITTELDNNFAYEIQYAEMLVSASVHGCSATVKHVQDEHLIHHTTDWRGAGHYDPVREMTNDVNNYGEQGCASKAKEFVSEFPHVKNAISNYYKEVQTFHGWW